MLSLIDSLAEKIYNYINQPTVKKSISTKTFNSFLSNPIKRFKYSTGDKLKTLEQNHSFTGNTVYSYINILENNTSNIGIDNYKIDLFTVIYEYKDGWFFNKIVEHSVTSLTKNNLESLSVEKIDEKRFEEGIKEK